MAASSPSTHEDYLHAPSGQHWAEHVHVTAQGGFDLQTAGLPPAETGSAWSIYMHQATQRLTTISAGAVIMMQTPKMMMVGVRPCLNALHCMTSTLRSTMIGLPAYYIHLPGESLQMIDMNHDGIDTCKEAHKLLCEACAHADHTYQNLLL